MKLLDAIHAANIRDKDLRSLPLRSDLRTRVAASLFAISQNHQKAILTLLSTDHSLTSTAFSLLRLLLETTIRGIWVLRCATETQVENLIDGRQKQIDMRSIFIAVDEERKMRLGRDSNIESLYGKHWKFLSAYTHGFEQQIQRWLTTSNIEPAYSSEEIEELICRSNLLADLAYRSTLSLKVEEK